MLDVRKDVGDALAVVSSSLPVYYELFIDSKTSVPCITYMQNQNNDNVTSDVLGYSNIGFTIKLWTTKVSDIVTYAPTIDSKMRALGYSRTSTNELTYNDQIQCVLMYQALAKEYYN